MMKFLKGWRQPSILHYALKKHWKIKFQFKTQRFFQENWWEYALKSGEYKNILNFAKYKKFKNL